MMHMYTVVLVLFAKKQVQGNRNIKKNNFFVSICKLQVTVKRKW